MSTMNVLESFFPVNTTSGMDLAKGVPVSRTESASRSTDGASFEGILEDEVQSQASTDGSLISETDSPKGENTDVGSTPVQVKSSDEDLAEDVDVEVEMVQDAMSVLAQVQILKVDPALEAKTGEELQANSGPTPDSAVAVATEGIVDVLRKDENSEAGIALPAEMIEAPASEDSESLDAANINPQQAAAAASVMRNAAESAEVSPKEISVEPSVKKISTKSLDLDAARSIAPGSDEEAVNAVPQDFKDLLENSFGESKESALAQPENLDQGLAKPVSLKSFVDELFVHQNLLESKVPQAEMPQELNLGLTQTHPTVKTQVLQEMKPLISNLMVDKMGGEMTIQLKPANLGEVRVDVKVVEDSVKVSFHAENASARLQLQSQASDLRSHMQAAGLKVDQLSFSTLSAQENSRNGDSRDQQPAHQNPSQDSRHEQQAHQNRKNQDDSKRFWSAFAANESMEANL